MIFKFESSFKISAGARTNPDLVLISQTVMNTLLVEWTQILVIDEHKKDQIGRYSRISAADLTDILAIPPSAVNTFNAILIVQPTALESFKAFLGDRGWRFLSSFSTRKKVRIR